MRAGRGTGPKKENRVPVAYPLLPLRIVRYTTSTCMCTVSLKHVILVNVGEPERVHIGYQQRMSRMSLQFRGWIVAAELNDSKGVKISMGVSC